MKINKYYILLLLCFFVWEMKAQVQAADWQFERIRVRYGAHDAHAWTNVAVQNDALRGSNPNHTGEFYVPAVPGAFRTRAEMWGAGAGSGGSAAISLLSRLIPLALPTSPTTYASTGGGGGGGFQQNGIGLRTSVFTLDANTDIVGRTPAPFVVHVGAGGVPGTAFSDGGFISDTQSRGGGAGGDTWVVFGNTVRGGGGLGSAGQNITFGLLYAIAADPFSIADTQSSSGGRGGSPQSVAGSSPGGNWSDPLDGLVGRPSAGNAGEGGAACNAWCSSIAIRNRFEGAMGGHGGRVANHTALTGEFGNNAGQGGGRQEVRWSAGVIPGAVPSGTQQSREGLHGVFPGGGAGGAASVARRRVTPQIFPPTAPHDSGTHARGGAGANGLAFIYMDIFAQAASTPELAIVYPNTTVNVPLSGSIICAYEIDHWLVVTNPQPVEYFWYRSIDGGDSWVRLPGATDPYLHITSEGMYKVYAATFTGVFEFPGSYEILRAVDGHNSLNVEVASSAGNFSVHNTVTIHENIGTPSAPSQKVSFLQMPRIGNLAFTVASGAPAMMIGRDEIIMQGNPHDIVPNGTLYTWTLHQSDQFVTGTTTGNEEPAVNTGVLVNSSFTPREIVYRVTPVNFDPRGETCSGAAFNITITVLPADLEMTLPMQNVFCVGMPFTLGTDRTEDVGTWSSSDPVITVTGNGVIFSSRPGAAYITFTSEAVTETVMLEARLCDFRVNPHIRATFDFDCVPMTELPVVAPSGTLVRLLHSDGSPHVPGIDDYTTFRAIAHSQDGQQVSIFEWFVDGESQGAPSAANTFTLRTPNIAPLQRETIEITVRAFDACTGVDEDGNFVSGSENAPESATVYMVVEMGAPSENPDVLISGQQCFDVRMTGHTGNCLPLTARFDDFARDSVVIGQHDDATLIYHYFASRRVFTYQVVSRDGVTVSGTPNLVVHQSLSGMLNNYTIVGNTITLTFAEDIHTRVEGRIETVILEVSFTAAGSPQTIARLHIDVQDCACGCRVRTVGGGWLTFMCYNLGVTDAAITSGTMTLLEQAALGATAGTGAAATAQRARVHGGLFQWGREADGHENRTSMRRAGRQVLTVGNSVPPAAVGRFITSSGTPHTWHTTTGAGGVGAATPRARQLWDGNEGVGTERAKTVNDPCPPGWRVPTIEEWRSIANGTAADVGLSTTNPDGVLTLSGNTWRWVGSGSGTGARGGWVISPNANNQEGDPRVYTLYLPTTGYRSGVNTSGGANAVPPVISQHTAHYWSSTPRASNIRGGGDSYQLRITATTLQTTPTPDAGGGGRIDGQPIRCVME